MSYQYDLYLQKHKANVKKGFDWLQTNMPWLFEGKPDAAWQTEFEHDASKSKPDEYEAYDARIYIRGKFLWVEWKVGRFMTRSCPYSSTKAFAQNWDLAYTT